MAPAGRPVVAWRGGPAFSFVYAETTELLEAAGCEVATFDPLVDEALPAGATGLYLGGGFPEEHVAALSANTSSASRGTGLPWCHLRRVRRRSLPGENP